FLRAPRIGPGAEGFAKAGRELSEGKRCGRGIARGKSRRLAVFCRKEIPRGRGIPCSKAARGGNVGLESPMFDEHAGGDAATEQDHGREEERTFHRQINQCFEYASLVRIDGKALASFGEARG